MADRPAPRPEPTCWLQPSVAPSGRRSLELRAVHTGRSAWHLRANLLVLGWLAASAAALVARVALPVPRWLLVHMLMLGAVTTAIMVWSEHFATALLRAPALPRRRVALRLAALTAAVLGVLAGVLAGWAVLVTAAAALLVVVVLAHHAADLARLRRARLAGRFAGTVSFYLAAAAALASGVVAGTLLAVGAVSGVWEPRLQLAHLHLNLLGWVGLSVIGTELTLWPTVLRTRMASGVPAAARTTLALLVAGLSAAVVGVLAGQPPVVVVGLVGYAAGIGVSLVPFLRAARSRPPRTGSAWMLAAGTTWLTVAVVADAVGWMVSTDVLRTLWSLDRLLPVLLVGVAAQVLLGALCYLLPVVLGGGPQRVRLRTARLEAGWLPRTVLLNLGVLAIALPLPPLATVLGWSAVVVSVGTFLALAGSAIGHFGSTGSAATTSAASMAAPAGTAPGPAPQVATVVDPLAGAAAAGRPTSGPDATGGGAEWAGLAGGVAIGALLLAVGLAVALSGRSSGGPEAAPVVSGPGVHFVEVSLANLRIRPSVVRVEPGAHLVLHVTNRDSARHDLLIDGRGGTPLLAKGSSALLELGAVDADLNGWCTVSGHRQAGMTFEIRVVAAGRPGSTGAGPPASRPGRPAVGSTPATAVQWPVVAEPPGLVKAW